MSTLLFFLTFNIFIAFSTTYYVNDDASGANNGLTWNDAYTLFQDALDIATSGDEIWVAAGTYKPSFDYGLGGGTRYYHFRMINGVSIYGGFAGTETAVSQRTDYGLGESNESIISGDLNGDDSGFTNNTENVYHVFYHPNGYTLNNNSILDGFTIRNGNANGTGIHESGGGIHNNDNDPTIRNCTFYYNRSVYGGGIYNEASESLIENCLFQNNYGEGGGIRNVNANPTISSSTFISNSANFNGGGIDNVSGSSATIETCIFRNNSANGAAFFAYVGSDVVAKNCLIYENNGFAIFVEQSNPNIINTTIVDNSGEGIRIKGSSHCQLINSICYNNSGGGREFYLEGNSATLSVINSCYSNVPGYLLINTGSQSFTTNSITSDPQFVDTANDDYRLSINSPCIDIGDNSYISESYDFRGINFGRKLNKHNAQSGTIDIGAYEFRAGYDGIGVVSNIVTEITTNSAETGGQIIAVTIPAITDKGIVYSTSPNPTILSNKLSSGAGSGNFTTELEDLVSGVRYYVRAYATNSEGTVYGEEYNFRTFLTLELDGNQDNIADSLQDNVYTFYSNISNNFITIFSPSSTTLTDVTNNLNEIDENFVYPYGNTEFKINASQAEVKIYYHGTASLDGYTYRKLLPNDTYGQFDNVTFSTEIINGNEVAVATLNLVDGGAGDYDGIVNGVIYDPGGPSLPVSANIPYWDWWWVLVLVPIIVYSYKKLS